MSSRPNRPGRSRLPWFYHMLLFRCSFRHHMQVRRTQRLRSPTHTRTWIRQRTFHGHCIGRHLGSQGSTAESSLRL